MEERNMMTHDHIAAYLWRRPFQPFRVRLVDGRAFDITHPNLGLLSETILMIGIPDPKDPEPIYYVGREWVYFKQIAGIEPLHQALNPAV
jgi:hypothetical protein